MQSKWTDQEIEAEIRQLADKLGHFPSASDMRRSDREWLCSQVSRRGGFLAWSQKVGIDRQHSDSDTGWAGEAAFAVVCGSQGLSAVRVSGVKSPFDLTVNDVLRVDVKAANYAEYACGKNSKCRGWFYRLGKKCQADLVVLYQLDTGNFYGIPWWGVPIGNITVARDGGKYAGFLNNWPLIRQMLAVRQLERAQLELDPVVAVA